MLTIEEQIERIADAAERQSTADRPGRSPRWLLMVAAVLVAGALAGVVAIAQRDVQRVEPLIPASQPSDEPVPPVAIEPTIGYVAGDEWWVVGDLPAGVGYQWSVRTGHGMSWSSYGDGERTLIVEVHSDAVGPDAVGRPSGSAERRSIAGVEWEYERSSGESDDVTISRELEDGSWLVLHGSGLWSDSEVEAIAASIALRPATELPRPPYHGDPGDGVAVSEVVVNGILKTLTAQSDGVSFRLGFDGGATSPVVLADEVLVVDGASGPPPTLVGDDREAESVLYGIARADVATVEIVLTDGRVASAAAEDRSGRFVERFFAVAFPTRTEQGMELGSEIIARDTAGNELARIEFPF